MQYLLLLSIALFFGVSTWAVQRVGRKSHLTISQHVGRTRTTRVVFGIVGSIATLLASLTIFGWILPRYDAGTFSYVVYGLLMLGFLVAAIIPYVRGTWRARVHNLAAWGMCFIIPVAIFTTILLWPLADVVRVISYFLLVAECSLLLAFFTVRQLRKQFLIFQSVYLTIFFGFLFASF